MSFSVIKFHRNPLLSFFSLIFKMSILLLTVKDINGLSRKYSTGIKDDQRRELYKESKHIEKVASVMFRHINIYVRSFMEEIRTRFVFK